jgi:hypothetical protein
MDKTTREYAEELAISEYYNNDLPGGGSWSKKIAFERGYLKAIEKTNVKQLAEDNQSKEALIKELAEANERFKEALKKIDHLLLDDESNYDVWEIAYDALNNIK